MAMSQLYVASRRHSRTLRRNSTRSRCKFGRKFNTFSLIRPLLERSRLLLRYDPVNIVNYYFYMYLHMSANFMPMFVVTFSGAKDSTPDSVGVVGAAFAGSGAALVVASVICPTELVKCRLQAALETRKAADSTTSQSPQSLQRQPVFSNHQSNSSQSNTLNGSDAKNKLQSDFPSGDASRAPRDPVASRLLNTNRHSILQLLHSFTGSFERRMKPANIDRHAAYIVHEQD